MSASRRKALVAELGEKEQNGFNNLAPLPHGLVRLRSVSVRAKVAVAFSLRLVSMVGDVCPVSGNVHVFMFKCPCRCMGCLRRSAMLRA
jgi:hypothetical protein